MGKGTGDLFEPRTVTNSGGKKNHSGLSKKIDTINQETMRENTKSINQWPLYDNAGERRLDAEAAPRTVGIVSTFSRRPIHNLIVRDKEISQRQLHHNQARGCT